MDNNVAAGPENIGEVVIAFLVYGDTKWMHTHLPGLLNSVSCILYPVSSFVLIQVIWFAVSQNQQQSSATLLVFQQVGSMSNTRAHTRVVVNIHVSQGDEAIKPSVSHLVDHRFLGCLGYSVLELLDCLSLGSQLSAVSSQHLLQFSPYLLQ